MIPKAESPSPPSFRRTVIPMFRTAATRAQLARPLVSGVQRRCLTQNSAEARRYSFAHAFDDVAGEQKPKTTFSIYPPKAFSTIPRPNMLAAVVWYPRWQRLSRPHCHLVGAPAARTSLDLLSPRPAAGGTPQEALARFKCHAEEVRPPSPLHLILDGCPTPNSPCGFYWVGLAASGAWC